MDGIQPEQQPVYHDEEMSPFSAEDLEEVWGAGQAPRLFVLVRDLEEYTGDDEDDECAAECEPEPEVVAYGIALPGGGAATVFARGRGFGRWVSPESASRRHCSDLVWLSPENPADDRRRPSTL